MKKRLISYLTTASMALAPLAPLSALADGTDGSKPPKNNCSKEIKRLIKNEIWKSDRTDLKDQLNAYYQRPADQRPYDEQEFCESIANGWTEGGFCAPGQCRAKTERRDEVVTNGRDMEIAARRQAPAYREETVVVQQRPPQGGAVIGGGDGGGGGMMMMMMMMAMMASMNSRQQQSPYMFPPPRGGPFGQPPPFMPMRPGMGGAPQFAPYSRPGTLGGPGMIGGLGGIGGYGGVPGYGAYGGPSLYNGAGIYNGGGAGYYGGAGAYSSNYFSSPGPAPAIINPATGMRTYSVLGR